MTLKIFYGIMLICGEFSVERRNHTGSEVLRARRFALAGDEHTGASAQYILSTCVAFAYAAFAVFAASVLFNVETGLALGVALRVLEPWALGRVVSGGSGAAAAGLDPLQPHCLVIDERVEHPGGVGSSPDAGHHDVGQPVKILQALAPCFSANHRLEVADHHRIRVRTYHATDQIMGGIDIGHPVPDTLVDGVL